MSRIFSIHEAAWDNYLLVFISKRDIIHACHHEKKAV